jgi:hypothetical protein
MSAASTPAPYVASASTELDAARAAYKAFDGNLGANQFWSTSAAVQTGWLKIDLGAAWIITNYNVVANDDPTCAPAIWTLEGSNDDAAWAVLHGSFASQTGWSARESRAFVCDTIDTAYRYFMLNVTDNNGDTTLRVGEWYLQGEAVAAATTRHGPPSRARDRHRG